MTSPDYYGNFADIAGLAKLCRMAGIPLLVDNAHGAYLRFLSPSRHPMDLGADLCCDSAHKTLPVLTGGAYLHIAKSAPPAFSARAKSMMALFASTSPSYLILQSLDACNRILSEHFGEKLAETARRLAEIRAQFAEAGFLFVGEEPLKLTLLSRNAGFTGLEVAQILRDLHIEPEMAEPDAVVLMVSPWNTAADFMKLSAAAEFFKNHRRAAIPHEEQFIHEPLAAALPMREARLSPCQLVSVEKAEGRICAEELCTCQPSVPIAAPGEILNENVIKICRRYSIFTINVVK